MTSTTTNCESQFCYTYFKLRTCVPPWNLPSMRICDSPTPINESINNNYKSSKINWKIVTWWIKKKKINKKKIFCTTVWPYIYIRDAIGKKVPIYCDNDTRIPLSYRYIYNTISVWTIVRPEYSTWRFSFTILPYYSTALIISKNFHILSSFTVYYFPWTLILFLIGLKMAVYGRNMCQI